MTAAPNTYSGLPAAAAEQRRAEQKRLATVVARGALAGWAVALIEGDAGGGEIVATRAAATQRFAGLAEVERWLDGGAA